MERSNKGLQFAVLAGVLAAFALASVQSARISVMRENERVYRWVVSAASFAAFGESLEGEPVDGAPAPLDDELFAQAVALGETALPDLPVGEEDVDAEGRPKARLLRAVRQGVDKPIYNMLASQAASDLVSGFLDAAKNDRLVSLGTQFTTASLYDRGNQTEGVGLTSLFFGLRKLAANFLWLQVDSFWHGGQMHRMVPAMRATVALDPNFVDAYLVGAWHLAYNLTAKLGETPEPLKKYSPKYKRRLSAKEEWYYIAAEFLKDGIRKNPREYRLYFDLGYAIYESKLDDHANAVLYLKEARRYKHDRWVPRMLYLAMWRNGQYDEAITGWLDYLEKDPNNISAKRFLQINRAYLAETTSEQAAECAKAARAAADELRTELTQLQARNDTAGVAPLQEKLAEAERVAAEMDALVAPEWEKAKSIYEAMIRASEDPIAKSRMLRHTALDFAKQGRYIEAISQIELARYEMLENFTELSDLMIQIKQEGGLPLSVSEELAVAREAEAAAYAQPNRPKPKRFVECAYLQEADSAA